MRNELANDLMNMETNFFNDLSEPFLRQQQSQGLASDVTEDDKEYQVTVDIPGVDKKNIDVAYNDDILHVHVKKDATINKKDKKGDILAEERSYGEFVRNYPLPDVKSDQISAKVNQGILTINLPKVQEGQREHRIKIN